MRAGLARLHLPGGRYFYLVTMRLALLKRQEEGPAYSLYRFHDAALSWGAPPVPPLREVMLDDPGNGGIL